MRLFPKSLTTQLVALLLAALVIIQGASFLVLNDERHIAAREVGRQYVLYRTASAVRLLNETPLSLHKKIVASLTTPRLRIELNNKPSIVSTPSDRRSQRLSGILKRILEQPEIELNLSVLQNSQSILSGAMGPSHARRWQYRNTEKRRHQRSQDKFVGGQFFGLGISVPLQSGQWLNVTTLAPAQPPALGLYTLLTLIISAIILTLIVVLMIRRVTKPMRQLTDAAERFGRGEAVDPLPEIGPDDIQRTTRAFNTMQERLNRFVQDRTQLLAAISHDLRTPITSLRLRAELVKDRQIQEKIIASLDEMQSLIEATLEFARQEASQEKTRVVSLTALGESVCQDLKDIGLETHFTDADTVQYRCRANSLKRALSNLVENAARYGNKAEVCLLEKNDELVFVIDDDGAGIPESELDRVFEPFVRLENSRSRETGGIGLGLAIARTIARAHGGDISLANRSDGGLRAEIHLPVIDSDSQA